MHYESLLYISNLKKQNILYNGNKNKYIYIYTVYITHSLTHVYRSVLSLVQWQPKQ